MPANPQVTEQMVEKAADTIAEMLRSGMTGKSAIEEIAKRCLTAALADHVVVPRHPTPKMQRAGYEALDNTGDCNCSQHDVWDAMISAASPTAETRWTPPFKVGECVRHTGRNEVGTVIAVADTVDVQFDKLNSKGKPSIGRYDENWFKEYPAGLVPASPSVSQEG
jgi:hypothetical protein